MIKRNNSILCAKTRVELQNRDILRSTTSRVWNKIPEFNNLRFHRTLELLYFRIPIDLKSNLSSHRDIINQNGIASAVLVYAID